MCFINNQNIFLKINIKFLPNSIIGYVIVRHEYDVCLLRSHFVQVIWAKIFLLSKLMKLLDFYWSPWYMLFVRIDIVFSVFKHIVLFIDWFVLALT